MVYRDDCPIGFDKREVFELLTKLADAHYRLVTEQPAGTGLPRSLRALALRGLARHWMLKLTSGSWAGDAPIAPFANAVGRAKLVNAMTHDERYWLDQQGPLLDREDDAVVWLLAVRRFGLQRANLMFTQ